MKLQEDWVYASSLLIKKNIFRKTFKCHILHNKWSFPLRTSSVNGPNPQKTVDLVPFTEEILNGKIHFLCSVWIPCISMDKPYFISNERLLALLKIQFLSKLLDNWQCNAISIVPIFPQKEGNEGLWTCNCRLAQMHSENRIINYMSKILHVSVWFNLKC